MHKFHLHGSDQRRFHQYGYIHGLKDFQIEFITQAANTLPKKGIELKTTKEQAAICGAYILRMNYQHTDQKLYIAFDKEGKQRILSPHISKGTRELQVCVYFHLKRSYFTTLEKSVEKLPSAVIHRIMPEEVSIKESYGLELNLDRDQTVALETILRPSINHPQRNFPILINGPFGTGKTYILAGATYKLLQHHPAAQVLVCTQQRESAENFFLSYLSCGETRTEVATHLLIEYGQHNPRLKPYYLSAKDLTSKLQSQPSTETKLLIVSTCITSQKVSTLDIKFSHIMIDEGGLMREPEATIPLCMANERTKIVIAGDPQQVQCLQHRQV